MDSSLLPLLILLLAVVALLGVIFVTRRNSRRKGD